MSDPNTPDHLFDWETVASELMASKGITTGLWRLGVRLQFAALTAVWSEDAGGALPTGMVGVHGVALFKADAPGLLTFDAAKLAMKREAKATTALAVARLKSKVSERRAKRRLSLKKASA